VTPTPETLGMAIEKWYRAQHTTTGMCDIGKPTLEKWAGMAEQLEKRLEAAESNTEGVRQSVMQAQCRRLGHAWGGTHWWYPGYEKPGCPDCVIAALAGEE